ncbi:hypothetical protein FACS1894211_07420 [Clostridia bacterium]|nr:hypothetical protein FACS1894211_07420 [Clostridia bacterium]
MIKVLFLTNIPSPYRVCFFNALGRLCELTVVFELKSASNRVVGWQEFSATTYSEIYLNGKQTAVDAAKCRNAKKYLTDNYDIIVLGGYATPTQQIAIKYLHKKKIPFILNSDGAFIPEKESVIKKWYKKFLIGKADAWITSGQNSVRQLEYYGANRERIFVYPFSSVGIDDIASELPAKERSALREELGIHEKKIIITVGAFIERKGIATLLKAAKSLIDDDIGVYIIGGEPNAEYLDLVGQNSKIHFMKHLQKADLTKYYKASDLFVLPTREDIWGLVVNEAMAVGLPVITTNKCNAGLELVKDGINGYLIDVDDVNALTDRIRRVIFNDEKLSAMSRYNLDLIKDYTYTKMAERHLEIFNVWRDNV